MTFVPVMSWFAPVILKVEFAGRMSKRSLHCAETDATLTERTSRLNTTVPIPRCLCFIIDDCAVLAAAGAEVQLSSYAGRG